MLTHMTNDSRRNLPTGSLCCGRASTIRFALAVLIAAASGCSVVQHETVATKSLFGSLTGEGGKSKTTNVVEVVQTGVMREADLYVGAVAQATDDFRIRVPTIEARNAAQQWKLTEATAAYINASGENPLFNAVDMVVLATLSRYVVEDYWVGEKYGEAARPLLVVHQQLESNAWTVVSVVLTPGQQEEVRKLLREYREEFPDMRYVAAVRLREVAGTLGKLPNEVEQGKKPGSLFSLLYINPLAGLDPTTVAIQQTRLLAQRAMYYAQRAPMLLGWQIELTTYQMAAQPEARGVLTDLDDVAQSTKVFAQTAAGLTNLVNAQREAAINQIFDRLALAQTNLVAELASQEAKLRSLLNETRQTLDAGSDMAKSANAAIQSLDAFMHYVSPPDTNAVASPPDTNSHPFNVLDYGTAATQVGAMARDLNTLLTSANRTAPEVEKLSKTAANDLQRVVHRAFWLGMVLIVVLLVGSVCAALVYRRLTRKTG